MSGFTVVNVEIPHGSDYVITGPDCQILSLLMKPGHKITTEPGSMMFMSPGVKSSSECGSCSRTCSGETFCKVIYENKDGRNGYIGLTPNFPAKIIPINLSEYGGKIIAKRGAYFSSIGDASVDYNLDCGCITSTFGGLGCCRQQVTGNGTAFLAAGGTVVIKNLSPNETIVIDYDSVVGFEASTTLGARFSGGPLTICCGGEGCCVNTLTGPGKVVLQSMSFDKFRAAVAPPPQKGEGDASAAGAGAN